ncbi:MAG TPA: hypothetical protein VFY29_17010 [Terriglobia bacterium]|nr:hypothetical protein [Terriglobia bacterium]
MLRVLVARLAFTGAGSLRVRVLFLLISWVVLTLSRPNPADAQSFEGAKDALQRAGLNPAGGGATKKDSVREGVVVVYNDNGSKETFQVTLVRNGDRRAQHIILKMPDGRIWDGRGDHLSAAGRRALDFLETQFMQGTERLLDAPARNALIRDDGANTEGRALTVREKDGATAQYIVDPATLNVRRFDFHRGQAGGDGGIVQDAVEAYTFSDFRDAGGNLVPYRVEHFRNGVRREELTITKVQQVVAARNTAPQR